MSDPLKGNRSRDEGATSVEQRLRAIDAHVSDLSAQMTRLAQKIADTSSVSTFERVLNWIAKVAAIGIFGLVGWGLALDKRVDRLADRVFTREEAHQMDLRIARERAAAVETMMIRIERKLDEQAERLRQIEIKVK